MGGLALITSDHLARYAQYFEEKATLGVNGIEPGVPANYPLRLIHNVKPMTVGM